MTEDWSKLERVVSLYLRKDNDCEILVPLFWYCGRLCGRLLFREGEKWASSLFRQYLEWKNKRIKVVDFAYTNKKQFANLQLYLHSKQPELNKNLKCQHLKCRGERWRKLGLLALNRSKSAGWTYQLTPRGTFKPSKPNGITPLRVPELEEPEDYNEYLSVSRWYTKILVQ